MNKKAAPAKIKIANKAIEMMKTRGYSHVSVAEICKELNITRSAFYYHFKTKDEVFDYFLLMPEMYIVDHILPLLGTVSPLAQFYQMFEMFFKRVEDVGPEIIGFVFKRNIDGAVNNIFPHSITMWDVYIEIIQKAQTAGEIKKDVSAETLVAAAVHITIGVGVMWCNRNGSFSYAEECTREVKALISMNQKTQ